MHDPARNLADIDHRLDADMNPGYEWRREMLDDAAAPAARLLPCGGPAIVTDLAASLRFPGCRYAELPDGRWIHA